MTEKKANTATQQAEQLNALDQRHGLDRIQLKNTLLQADGPDFYQMITEGRPHLFSEATVFVTEADIRRQQQLIRAINAVVAMPVYQQQVLAYAPASAQFIPKAQGVFLGYDFHLSASGSKLIEINTNAGGALLNALLIRSQPACLENGETGKSGDSLVRPTDMYTDGDAEQAFLHMFLREWRLERGLQALRSIAIVDEQPQQQYMLPEFMLFKQLFEGHGIQTIICDPCELTFKNNALYHDQTVIDLVYNRHTDFGFETSPLQQLAEAYFANAVVVTPHPRAHALYADKRNLVLLSDPVSLAELGVDAATCAV
ncbi:MAG: hypothetical protein ABL925_06505, partial [Methylococcales bacterium]